MTEETNASGTVIIIGDERFTVHPDLLRGWAHESLEYLSEIEGHKASFKELVETASETTKIPKALISKYLKARYKQETKKAKAEGSAFEQLDEALESK